MGGENGLMGSWPIVDVALPVLVIGVGVEGCIETLGPFAADAGILVRYCRATVGPGGIVRAGFPTSSS